MRFETVKLNIFRNCTQEFQYYGKWIFFKKHSFSNFTRNQNLDPCQITILRYRNIILDNIQF
jgi:hypothetical protein